MTYDNSGNMDPHTYTYSSEFAQMRPSEWSHAPGLDSYSGPNVTAGLPALLTQPGSSKTAAGCARSRCVNARKMSPLSYYTSLLCMIKKIVSPRVRLAAKYQRSTRPAGAGQASLRGFAVAATPERMQMNVHDAPKTAGLSSKSSPESMCARQMYPDGVRSEEMDSTCLHQSLA